MDKAMIWLDSRPFAQVTVDQFFKVKYARVDTTHKGTPKIHVCIDENGYPVSAYIPGKHDKYFVGVFKVDGSYQLPGEVGMVEVVGSFSTESPPSTLKELNNLPPLQDIDK